LDNMATTDDALETYTHLPVHIDPATKQVSVLSSDKATQDAIAIVNDLHAQFKKLETANNVPPPPIPVDQKRTVQIRKLQESATQAAKKGQYSESIKLANLALQMAASRPDWEPSGLKREELHAVYLTRAEAHAGNRDWVDAHRDAVCSTECKKGPQRTPQGQNIPGNPKAWTVAGRALLEMSRTEEAVEWLRRGVEIEGTQAPDTKDLADLLKVAQKKQESEG
jgi:translocation protein SEC72